MKPAPIRLHPGEYQYAHVSVRFTTAEPDDPVVKELILRGKARVFGTMLGPKGETLNIIRHRGTTYRRETPKAPSKRDRHRQRTK